MELFFPNQLEVVAALRWCIATFPKDAVRARYHLGNYLYAYDEPAQALRLWTEAIDAIRGKTQRQDLLYGNDSGRVFECFLRPFK